MLHYSVHDDVILQLEFLDIPLQVLSFFFSHPRSLRNLVYVLD